MAGNVAPSDINPLADYVQGAVCVWKKKRKQNIHMLLRASGMRWMQRMDVWAGGSQPCDSDLCLTDVDSSHS